MAVDAAEDARDDVVLDDDSDRYAIMVLAGDRRDRIAYTSRDGIGCALVTLRDEEQLDVNDAVGVYDRRERRWVVNPYGRPRPG